MIARLLARFTEWALWKNPPGTYQGEGDKRWAYTIATDGTAYLTRVMSPDWMRRLFGFRPYLHHFHREDIDRHLHSHPWKWALSIVLCGSYDETRLEWETTGSAYGSDGLYIGYREGHVKRRIRFFNLLTDRDYHKVDALHGDVWTLFITGPRIQNWGFLVDGNHVPWQEYLK